MSADLFAAFGVQEKSSAPVLQHENGPPDGTNPARNGCSVENTRQPWPKQDGHVTQRQVHDEPIWQVASDGNNVLFDADEHDTGNSQHEDDFGDFEKAEDHPVPHTDTKQTPTAPAPSCDLLDLGYEDSAVLTLRSNKVASADTLGSSVGDLSKSKTKAPSSLSNHTDDDWGTFEDVLADETIQTATMESKPPAYRKVLPVVKPNRNPAKAFKSATPAQSKVENLEDADFSGKSADFDDWDDFGSTHLGSGNNPSDVTRATSSPTKVVEQGRPTNIPPPAVLLSLIPQIYASLASATQVQVHDSSTSTASSTVGAYIVCARLIAGRTLRWKRDTLLAQSVRIGAAGRSGGMKLTVLDKSESRKEDQEVEEALSAWNRHSTKLNAAIIKAKAHKPPMSLSANLVVRTVSGSDVMIANHPCPICGLRRNERINGIDVNVSDVFGEFWIEHWGHTECQKLWYTYSDLLEQR